MKITDVQTIPVQCDLKKPLRWGSMEVTRKGNILVVVQTDEGVVGIGEAGFSVDYHSIVCPLIENFLKPLILGEDPTLIEQLWEKMYQATHKWGRRGMETYALSGVDIALWDILGKITGTPVYKLLGGRKRKVAAYAAPSLVGPDEVEKDCETAAARGFKAIKLRVGFDMQTDEEIVRVARNVVGDNMEIIVDANMAYDFRSAVEMADVFKQTYNVKWLEEPIASRSLHAYVTQHAHLARATNLRLSGGECLFTRYEFVPVFEQKAFDIVQPDATAVGGISEAAKISSMASAFGIPYVPHIACSSGTGIGLTANLHLICASSNAPYVEYDLYDDSALQTELLNNPLRAKDGFVEIGNEPGLGFEINRSALDKYRL